MMKIITIALVALVFVACALGPVVSAVYGADGSIGEADSSHPQVAPPHPREDAVRPRTAEPRRKKKDMIIEPHEVGKPENPDNMPIKRPDHKTNDRILHDRLASDALAR